MIDLKPFTNYLYKGFFKFTPIVILIFRFIIPFLLAGILVGILFWLYDDAKALQLGGLLLLYFIPPAGKETIIPAAIGLGFSYLVICISIIWIDLICCLFLLWNFELICKIPLMGTLFRFLFIKSASILSEHRWLEKLYVIGLCLFVFFPLQGTGSVSGSIIGKMLGLKNYEIFGAVAIGSILSSFLIGYSVYALTEYMNFNIWYIIAIIVSILVLFPIITYVLYQTKTGKSASRKISFFFQSIRHQIKK